MLKLTSSLVCHKIVYFWKVISIISGFLKNELLYYIWHSHEKKKIEKYCLVFCYTMKNKLENNLLIFWFFFQVYLTYIEY